MGRFWGHSELTCLPQAHSPVLAGGRGGQLQGKEGGSSPLGPARNGLGPHSPKGAGAGGSWEGDTGRRDSLLL